MKKVSPLLLFFIVFLLPLLPVCILYWQFGEMNYFGLEGAVKGVAATGPVGLYVFLFYVGRRYVERQMAYGEGAPVDESFWGTWELQSVVADSGEKRKSTTVISSDNGISLSGDWYSVSDVYIGSWSSRCVHVDGLDIHFTYVLSGMTGPDSYQGAAYGRLVSPGLIQGRWFLIDKQLGGSFVMHKLEN